MSFNVSILSGAGFVFGIAQIGSNLISLEEDPAIFLQPGEIFLLARSDESNLNGGLEPDYVYSNFTLSNTEDEIILCLPDGSVLDEVRYNSEWSIQKGVSLELDPNHMDAGFNELSNWKLSGSQYGSGDYGSPGSHNSSSTGIYDQIYLDELEIFPNPCFDRLNIKSKFSGKAYLDVSISNLVGQEKHLIRNYYCDELNIHLDTDHMVKGVWLLKLKYGKTTKIRKIIIL